MPLKYTTTANIEARLPARLQLTGTAQFPTSQVVPTPTADLIGAQVESRVDRVLVKQYKLPLALAQPDTQNLMGEVVEKLAIAELIEIYYQGNESEEDGGFGERMRRLGEKLLSQISNGEIVLPGEAAIGVAESVQASGIRTANRAPALETVRW